MAEDDVVPKNGWKITLQKIHDNRGSFQIPILMWDWNFPDGSGKVEIKAWPHLGVISFRMRHGEKFWQESPFISSDMIRTALSISCSNFGKPPDPPHIHEAFRDVLASKPIFASGNDLKKRQAMETLAEKWHELVSNR